MNTTRINELTHAQSQLLRVIRATVASDDVDTAELLDLAQTMRRNDIEIDGLIEEQSN